MKKILAFFTFLSIFLLLFLFSLNLFAASKLGDINNDNNITSSDVSLVERHILSITTLTNEKFTSADVNGDNRITSSDASLIERYLLGVILTFPTPKTTTTVSTTSTSIPPTSTSGTTEYNFAKALQYSLHFYDAEKCGTGITNGRLEWRGDCHTSDSKIPLKAATRTTPVSINSSPLTLYQEGDSTNLSSDQVTKYKKYLDPDGDGYMDLLGGMHDAGDHVKFGLPQAYTGSTLGWAFYEFRDAYIKSGQEEHALDILKWFNDYFLKSTFLDENGKVVAFCYQVGDGDMDHDYWGAPELQSEARPAFFATSENPATDQCADASASLTIQALNYKDTDPEYSAKCLKTAKALYEFACQYQGCGYSGGFYQSQYFEDELSWAAVWLNIATGDSKYIDQIASIDSNGNYTGYMKKIIKDTNNNWQNIWVHSWDVVWGGVFAKLAPITNNSTHWYFFRWNCEYWSGVKRKDPGDQTVMAATPGGFRVVNTWGSARYNTAAQLCTLVHRKYTGDTAMTDWAKNQMEYIMGNNPMKRNYIVGYAENSAKHPHHRAAHGSDTNSMTDPEEHKHTLWGALVGGPDGGDNHTDSTIDYVSNEVAIDYNAAFVGACAGLYKYYGEGQLPDSNFPPKEKPSINYYIKGRIEQEDSSRTQVVIAAYAKSIDPPRTESTIKARYYFDISELLKKGQDISALHVDCYYDEAYDLTKKSATPYHTKFSKPIQYKDNIYYVEIDWTGHPIYGKREFQLALYVDQDSEYKTNWDPTNDYSRKGLIKGDKLLDTTLIPLYLDGKLVYGNLPN